MNYERKFILTVSELRELLMESYVQGWYNKNQATDELKQVATAQIIARLVDDTTN